MVEESKQSLDLACERGVNEKELERLEKNYNDSLKLMKLYESLKKNS